ncbi:isochorismatase family protein, partial [Enterobacter hormaechei]|uniref:isochorismatase family protein n=1 Tax=Enterobacter hormaechei TaxID=158836 RepID=UPI003315F4FA
MLFPNFSLGEEYEHAPPATNRQISPYLPSGRFRTGLPVEGLAIERGDLFYACPRASVFYGTALDADLRTRGVSTLVMAGISTTGVVLSSVAWASDADYDVRFVQDCCYDPERDPQEALFPSGFRPHSSVAYSFAPCLIAAPPPPGVVWGGAGSQAAGRVDVVGGAVRD